MPFVFKSKKISADTEKETKIHPAGAWKNYSKVRRINAEQCRNQIGNKIIDVENISLSYENKAVVNNLSFQVYQGDYFCIVGENGSGKTTLLDALLGLKKPDCGKIDLLDSLKRNDIGFLPQHTEVQRDFPATVFEIVMSGCIGRHSKGPFLSKNDRQTAFTNMEKLGITSLSDRSYRELSGGQQQRVLLARALCSATRVLMLDEPVTGLDPKAASDMYSLVHDINKKEGITIIMISHDISSVLKYASHVLCLDRSKYFFGPVENFIKYRDKACEKQYGDDALYGNSDAYKFGGTDIY